MRVTDWKDSYKAFRWVAVVCSTVLPQVALAAGMNPGVATLAGQAPVRLILDTDMDSDCDDAGAMAVMHALANRGEVNILGVMTSALNAYSGPAVDAINTYYGRPSIPIGTARSPAPNQSSSYTQGVSQRTPHDLLTSSAAPDAVQLYRNLLMEQPNNSVTICTLGDMTNLAKLLVLPASGNLPSGMQLVQDKVKLWVCLGGNFVGMPAHDDLSLTNNNFTGYPSATYDAITQWPTPLVFVGREIGSVPSGLTAGARLSETPANNPVRIAYELFFGGTVRDRHVADLTAVLYAVRGLQDYWLAEGEGSMDLQTNMTFTWDYSLNRPQAYLLKTGGSANDRRIEDLLEELMIAPPLPVFPGDTNGDGVINLRDYNNVKNTLGATGQNLRGDANGDGLVNSVDLNLVKANFGAVRPFDSMAVPEPSACGVAVSALLIVGTMRLFQLNRKHKVSAA
jgi:hypothetical protein